MAFDASLFDPRTGSTTRVSARVFGSSLEVLCPGEDALRIDPGRAELRAGGWDDAQVQIVWPGEGGSYALIVTDSAAIAELARVPRFQEALGTAGRVQTRSASRGRLTMLIVVLIFLLPLVVVAAIYVKRDAIVDIVLQRIPTSVDQEVGRLFEGELTKATALPPAHEAVVAVNTIVARLRASSPGPGFDFRVAVQKNKEINAFAAPGGLIVVYSGLLTEAGSPEEIAGVLAHEMAHVTRRHSMRQMIYAAGILPLMGFLIGQPDAAAIFQDVSQLSELKFSREQESDADSTGFDTLIAARLKPEGMALFFDRLAKRDGPSVPSFLATHPASAERAAAIRARLAAITMPAPEPFDLDWPRIQASVR